jgi:hypothetical protein
MPAQSDRRWPALDTTWTEEIRPLTVTPDDPLFDDDYHPPIPVDLEPEPVPARLPSSWGDLHEVVIQRLRDSTGAAQRQLRYAIDGAKTFHYHEDVRAQLEDALDRITEAGRLMDIHDPE